MAKKTFLLKSKKKKAHALLDSGQLEQARLVLEDIVRLEQRDVDIWLMLGVIAGREKGRSDAVKFLRKALNLRPRDPQVLYNLGLALRESGDGAGAEAEFEAALSHSPTHSGARDALRELADLREVS